MRGEGTQTTVMSQDALSSFGSILGMAMGAAGGLGGFISGAQGLRDLLKK